VPSDRLVVDIATEPLSVPDVLAAVADPGAGATCVFVGTVRDHGERGAVNGLTYEAWAELARERIAEHAHGAFERWTLRRIAVAHRTGDLSVGEASVVIAVSAAHRADAFEACRHLIERLKADVPIWKKEALATGEGHWVQGA
jgi:molybdopterin synthase catalytic subunit